MSYFKLGFVGLIVFSIISLGFAQDLSKRFDEAPDEIASISAPFEMPPLKRPQFPDQEFNIKNFGAKSMSNSKRFKNTKAINKTIEIAHKAGGGKVIIPEGKWLTGPIHLMSNINLYLAEDAEVYFSKDKKDYLPVVPIRSGGVEAYNYSPPIYGYKVKNVAITGKGIFDAQGEHWWKWMEKYEHTPREKATKVRASLRKYGKGAGLEGMRPNFMVFWKSSEILIEGITLKDSPAWNVNPVYSENIIIRDITINSLKAPNGDGVALSSCKNVLVEYNHFETGDDAVVIKSGYNEEGLKVNIPTENVVVRNFKAKDVRTGSGGIVFGSETAGGIKNVYVHHAYFEGTDRGIRFKTARGRGNVIENIYIHDIQMKDIDAQAINFNTYYEEPETTGPAPLIRNINIHDIQIDGVPKAITLTGLPEKWLENFTFKNIVVKNAEEGARITRVKNLIFENVDIKSEKRAMEVADVFEFTLKNVTLKDQVEQPPILLEGIYTGAIFIEDDLDLDYFELGPEVSKKVIRKIDEK